MASAALQYRLSPERVRELSRPSILRALLVTALDWASIVSAIAISEHFRHPAIYALAIIFVGSRQQSILIQMHDAAHGRLAKSKLWNEILGELCAWPLFVRMSAYREVHRQHHKHLNTEGLDPDFRPSRFPKSRKELLTMLAKDLVGLNIPESFAELKRFKGEPSTGVPRALRIAFYLSLAIALTALGLWKLYLLYWLLPAFTWLKVCLRLRSIADHAGMEQRAKPFDVRVVVPNLFDRIFFAPRNSSYHLGHHFYEGVPSFNLKKLHHDLMQHDEIRARTHVTHGFWRLFLEFPWSEQKSAKSRAAALAPVLTTLK